jgi:extracellular matrix protein 14
VPTLELSYPQTPAIHDQTTRSPVSAGSSPFRKLRDSIIERIWDVPKKQHHKSKGTNPGQVAPSNLRTRYGNDVVLRFTIKTEDEAKAFAEAATILYLDVWDSSREWVDIRIAKEMLPSLLNLLPSSLQNAHKPLMHDLAQAVYDTYPSSVGQDPWRTRQTLSSSGPHEIFFEDYQPISVIYPWLRLQASLFPDMTELITIGTSAEGRDIIALRIGAVPDPKPREPRHTLLITGGSHAREWISVSTATYVAYSLLMRFASPNLRDPITTKLLTHYDIVFIPVLNPDGYDYTWSTDRLWRKTRQPTSLPFCPGIDIHRSFSFNWDGASDVDNPCMESYAGTMPFESAEAKALAEWAGNYTADAKAQFVAYLDLHSYSQQILYPYSYSCGDHPTNLEDLEEIGLGLAKSFRLTTGHHYTVSSACESALLPSVGATGGSPLYFFYHDMSIKYAYVIKLRDQGTHGFLLPRHHIVPSGRETLEAILGLGSWLLGNRGIEMIPNSDIADTKDAVNEKADKTQIKHESDLHSTPKSDSVESNYDDSSEWERVFDPDFEFDLKRKRK